MTARNAKARKEDQPVSLHALPKKGNQMDVDPLDRIIHEKLRLAIVSALAVNASLTFNELKELLGMSDGNLSVHTRKLEDAGYVRMRKGFAGRIPKTEYELTTEGRKALEKYLDHMASIIDAVRRKK